MGKEIKSAQIKRNFMLIYKEKKHGDYLLKYLLNVNNYGHYSYVHSKRQKTQKSSKVK